MTEHKQLFVGVDWATELHQICILDAQGQVVNERQVKHSGTELATLCDFLLTIAESDPSRIMVAIEIPHGAVIDTLLERSFHVHSINPKQLDRFRDRFCPSGAKDDRRDALVLASSLRTDPRAFRALKPDAAWVIELRELSRIHEELGAELIKLTNRMREQARRYFPALSDVLPDLSSNFALDLIRLIKTPERAHAVKSAQVSRLLQKHRIRRIGVDELLAKLREPALRLADGASKAAQRHLELLVERVALVMDQRRAVMAEIKSALEAPSYEDADEAETKQRDVEILMSLPGVGKIVAATLLSEASWLLNTQDYQRLRTLSGVAPVTKRSGKKLVVGMRNACHPRIRNALYHASRVASQHDPASKARYQALRARGASHGRALRTVADRLLRSMCAMLRNRTDWNPQRNDQTNAA